MTILLTGVSLNAPPLDGDTSFLTLAPFNLNRPFLAGRQGCLVHETPQEYVPHAIYYWGY